LGYLVNVFNYLLHTKKKRKRKGQGLLVFVKDQWRIWTFWMGRSCMCCDIKIWNKWCTWNVIYIF